MSFPADNEILLALTQHVELAIAAVAIAWALLKFGRERGARVTR